MHSWKNDRPFIILHRERKTMKKRMYLVTAVSAVVIAMSACSTRKESDSVTSERLNQNIQISSENVNQDFSNVSESNSVVEDNTENNQDTKKLEEQDIVEKITEAEDLTVIDETESSAANVNEAERKESTEEDETEISVTWQDAYKNIISNIPSNLADPYNFISEFGFNGDAYVGIHDFDNNNIPELIIGEATSVAVFTYEEGKAEKVADLYETEDWGGINWLCYKDNHLVLMSCGNGENAGDGWVCFTYEQGKYITGFYDDYQPNKATINGKPVSKEEFLLQFDIFKLKENNHLEFNNWQNSTIAYCEVNDEDEIRLAGNDEWIAIDDLDFSLIEW